MLLADHAHDLARLQAHFEDVLVELLDLALQERLVLAVREQADQLVARHEIETREHLPLAL